MVAVWEERFGVGVGDGDDGMLELARLGVPGSPFTDVTVPTSTTGALRVRSATENLIGPPGGGVQATAGVLLLISRAIGIATAAAMNSTARTGGLVAINVVPVPRVSGFHPF